MKNKIKKFFALVLMVAVPISVSYGLFSVISWDLNTKNWNPYVHGLFGVSCAIGVLLTIALFYEDRE